MARRDARSRWRVEADLLQRLIIKECISPSQSVKIERIEQWFLGLEHDLVKIAIRDLCNDDESPVKKQEDTGTKIWITDLDAARQYRESILQEEEWFKK
ncbi:hypothetical protein [Natrinema salinisoli]|uniref:hypothetical protein n=1 Tax=Natrinema salinisoli TaxID=2878535 RepID=UPI001CEFF0D4|nr:hypothetical protein [Natrinema salinisoli]